MVCLLYKMPVDSKTSERYHNTYHTFSHTTLTPLYTDEEIVIPKGSDEKFVAKLNQIFDESNATKSVYFTRQRRSPMDFTVRHFAGTCEKFVYAVCVVKDVICFVCYVYVSLCEVGHMQGYKLHNCLLCDFPTGKHGVNIVRCAELKQVQPPIIRDTSMHIK